MKNILGKHISIIAAVIIALSVLTVFAAVRQFNKVDKSAMTSVGKQDATDNHVVAEKPETEISHLEDPVAGWKDGEFEFLSGGYDGRNDVDGRAEGRILVYLAWDSNDPVYYTNDWQLDSFATSSNKQMVIYSTFHTQAKIYRVYRYDVASDTSTLLSEFDISDSELFTDNHIHLPISSLQLSPDAQHYYLHAYNNDHIASLGLEQDNFVQSTNGGDLIDLDIPVDIYQQYWFTNSEVAFSGANFAGSGYNSDYVQIYNIYSGLVSSTKIPARKAMSGLNPRVNPASTAYAYYNVTENHGYACGGSIMDLIVVSYPDGEELFRLEDLHNLEYRWLMNNELEIIYTPIPEVEDGYTPRSKTDRETLNAIQCAEQEIMHFKAP